MLACQCLAVCRTVLGDLLTAFDVHEVGQNVREDVITEQCVKRYFDRIFSSVLQGLSGDVTLTAVATMSGQLSTNCSINLLRVVFCYLVAPMGFDAVIHGSDPFSKEPVVAARVTIATEQL